TNVNDAPVIGALPALEGVEETAFRVVLPGETFTDVDGDILTYAVRAEGGGDLPDWLEFNPFTLILEGTPPENFFGDIALEVAVDDGRIETVQPITLSIANVNDAPVAASDVFNAGTATVITIPLDLLLSNDTDVDGDMLTVVSATDGAGFTTALDGLGNLVVTRDAALSGEIEVTYTVSDGTTTATAAVAIDLVATNNAPIITGLGDLEIDEDTELAITFPDGFVTDPEGDPVSITVTRAGGSTLPTWMTWDEATRSLSGTPPENFNGTIDLQMEASDGRVSTIQTFNLLIAPVNDVPILLAPFSDRSSVEDTEVNVLLQQDLVEDVDGDAITYGLTLADGSDIPAWLGFDADALLLTGLPPEDFAGDVELMLSISDGTATITDDFTLTVTGVNDAPELLTPLADVSTDTDGNALTTGQPFIVDAQTDLFADPDADPLIFAARLADGSALPDWLSFDGLTFAGTAPRTAAGAIEVEILASDGLEEVSDSLTLTFVEGNADPVANNDVYSASVPAGILIREEVLTANDTDADGDTLTVTSVSAAGNGTVTLEDGNVTYIPELDFEGPDSFTYTVDDGYGGTAEATVTVNVTNPFDDVYEDGDGNGVGFGGRGDDLLSGGGGNDILFGGRGNDYVLGGTGRDALFGGAGDDILNGGAGNDLIFGGRGADTIFGGEGNDLIFAGGGGGLVDGGAGNDRIFAGRGLDTFYFGSGSGRDTIYGFSTGGRRSFIEGDEIRIGVEGVENYSDLLTFASEERGGVLFDFGDGDELFLAGTRLAALDEDKFSFY
ncbi:MAG: tandem-95 repeat protein, partial [Pseudomonadota bacterium]